MNPNPISRVVEPVARIAAVAVRLPGAAAVVRDLRRDHRPQSVFGFTLQGTDDFGGYVLAIVAVIGASYTMAMRGHTRVDVFPGAHVADCGNAS